MKNREEDYNALLVREILEGVEGIVNEKILERLKMMNTKNKEYMNTTEACKYLGVCYHTFQKYLKEGLKYVDNGTKKVFRKESIDEFMRNKEVQY